MSLNLPARRLVLQTVRATSQASHHDPALHFRYLVPHTQRRHVSWNPFANWRRKKESKTPEDHLSDELLKQEVQQKLAKRQAKRTEGESIFQEELDEAKEAEGEEGEMGTALTQVKEHMQRALDPDPKWRMRWQRRKVMQHVRNGGRLTKEERIKMTEKESRFQSNKMATSTKKLMLLSRQVAGKTVDDAITQMRFSKKKYAKHVIYALQCARDEAIVSRGMGLGEANGELFDTPKKIQTKDGNWIEVDNPTRLYIDQSWVGKSEYQFKRLRYGARGRQSPLYTNYSRIEFILKEEKTRMRLHQERVEKKAKKKPWVHLPNRPITAQRPYYSW